MSIKVNNLSYIYLPKTPNETLALDSVSLEIPNGQITAVIGHTGSGKSTLIQTFNGLIKPSCGSVSIDDKFTVSSSKMKHKEVKSLRKYLSIVFQFPEYQLFEETVEKDVAYGLKNYGIKEEDAIKKAHEALKRVGISESFYQRSPFELSGGEKRRVAIAGIIVLEPEIIVLDEPTAGLDPVGSKMILDLIVSLKQQGKTIIIVTHDMNIVQSYCDHVVVLNDSKLAFTGTPNELFAQDVSKLSIEIPPLYAFCQELNAKGMKLDISKIQSIDDLMHQLKEKR